MAQEIMNAKRIKLGLCSGCDEPYTELWPTEFGDQPLCAAHSAGRREYQRMCAAGECSHSRPGPIPVDHDDPMSVMEAEHIAAMHGADPGLREG